MRAIGLMSGTSLDGVDAALVDTDGEAVLSLGPAETFPYDPDLRRDLRRLLDLAPVLAPDDPFLADVARRLTERHAEAVDALGTDADIVGFHGQTILHRPAQFLTWQIGDAGLLARATGLPVAHQFRLADVAAGGEGAPLAPIFHAALAQGLERPLAVLNLGGVANITYLGRHGELMAGDVGPGNALLDDWAERHTGTPCDQDGRLARAGLVDRQVLGRLMDDPYFSRKLPKSLDRLSFAATLAASGLERLSPEDGAATLAAFTAEAVASVRLPRKPRRWLVCGGGRRNPAILQALQDRLGGPVDPAERAGWDGDTLEAQCFGYLAVRVARGLPITFPATTGAPAPMTGGSVVHP